MKKTDNAEGIRDQPFVFTSKCRLPSFSPICHRGLFCADGKQLTK